jgi:hypothetical protein
MKMLQRSDRAERLVELMRTNAPANSLGTGVSMERIESCKQRLGLEIPKSYIWFLRSFGFADWPEYIYGLSPGLPPGLNLESKTEDERQNGRPRMPHNLLPFSPDGWGNHYCLDTSQMSNDECPVVLWNHDLGEDQEPELTHGTFLDWLEEAVQREIECDLEETNSSA